MEQLNGDWARVQFWVKIYCFVVFHIFNGNKTNWPEHSKVSKIFTLMGSFWGKYVLFELKKYRGKIFHDIEEWCKIWRGSDLLFQNWHDEFDKFWPKHSNVRKVFILMGSFWAKYRLFELKKYRGVIFHGTEEWCKIWKNWLVVSKLTWRIWRILTQALKSLKNFHFNGLLLSKVYILVELKKYRGVIFHDNEEWCKIWRKTNL